MMESRGTSITTGLLKEGKPIELVAGQNISILTDFAMEGDISKIATSYKDLCETVGVGSEICISLEQSPSDFARLEVTKINEVSFLLYKSIVCLLYRMESIAK